MGNLSDLFCKIAESNLSPFIKIIIVGIAEGIANIIRNLSLYRVRSKISRNLPPQIQKILKIPPQKIYQKNTEEGKVIFITGGSKGIGREVTRMLAELNYRVHIFSRSMKDMYLLSKPFKKNQIRFSFLDLGDLTKIGPILTEAIKLYDSLLGNWKLEYVICNAGVYHRETVFKKDIELNFLINHLGHHIFVKKLLPLRPKRFVFTSSCALYSVNNWCYENDPDLVYEEKDRLMTKYAMSKLANTLYALYQKKNNPGIEFVSVHPGMIPTNLFNNTLYGKIIYILRFPLYLALFSVNEGAECVINALFAEDLSPEKDVPDFYMREYRASLPSYVNMKKAISLMESTESLLPFSKKNS